MSNESTSFSIIITKSHVSEPFQLNLPIRFCKAHLPCHNDDIILEDETGEEHKLKFLISQTRLSYGWRSFAKKHGLREGDTVVFHLVSRCKFKVQVIKASGSVEKEFSNDMPLNIVKREDLTEENACRQKVHVRRKYLPTGTKVVHDTDSASPSLIENTESALYLKYFEEFKICVNGEMLDSEIPVDTRMKYYELCCVEKRLLHDRVKEDLNSKLVVSMILDVVSIADSAKATTISTSLDHLESMDKNLKSSEDSGMAVGSLRAKIGKLIIILNNYQNVAESTTANLEAIECERRSFMEKKAKTDELLDSATAQAKVIGTLIKTLDKQECAAESTTAILESTTAALECEIIPYLEKREKIDKLIESAMAQGKVIGRLEENVDGSKNTMYTLSLKLKEVAESTW